MKIISINETIGLYGNDNVWLEEQLKEADGEDVRIEISSPGGFVYPGLAMFNLIKNYSGNTTTHLMGLAASMAAYISLAGETRTSERTGVFMLHEVSISATGNSKDMFLAGRLVKGLTNLTAKVYSERSGIPLKEIKEMMAAETWLFGDEIKKAGFVHEITNTDKTETKDDAIAFAKLQYEECITLMAKNNHENINKAVALLEVENNIEEQPQNSFKNEIVNKPAITGAGKNKMEVVMTLEQLKAEHPDLYNKVYKAGAADRQDLINAHMQWIDIAPEAVKKNILEANEPSREIVSAYTRAAANVSNLDDRKEDDPDDIVVSNDDEKDEATKEKEMLDRVMNFSREKGTEV
jgi:ATP-dependent protease ClpP protease subunit